MQSCQLGPLACTLSHANFEASPPELLVVLCHGFGAPGTDLVPLSNEILTASSVPAEKVLFVYPAAPMVLESFGGFEGRAWWMINMQALAEMTGANDFSDLRTSIPPGIIEAREMLNETLDELFQRTGGGYHNLIIGGFSQGAMLTADTVLNSNQNPKCLVQMSGTLICENQWREKIQSHAGLRVLQSHGQIDPVLPFQAAEWLNQLYVENACDVDFLPFHGVHTIPMEMISKLGNEIARALDDPDM